MPAFENPRAVIARPRAALDDPVVLFHGAAVERRLWETLDRLEQRRLLVRTRFATLRTAAVVSHRSAAALWGLPEFGQQDPRLHVIEHGLARTHCSRGVVRHGGPLTSDDVTLLDGIPVTTVLRTVVDVVRTVSLTHAVVVLDHALRRGVVRQDVVADALAARAGGHGVRRARAALDLADPSSESPGESVSRVAFRELRLQAPVLQQEFATDRGRFRVDFWWPDHRIVGEFDGRVKYDDRDALWHEKLREDALRRHADIDMVARWTMSDALDPSRLAGVLLAAGLPVPRAVRRR